MQNFAFTEKEIQFLRELSKEKIPFIIIDLSAAAIHGAPVVTQDVDLWFKDLSDQRFQNAVKIVGAIYVPPIDMNPPMLGGEDFELFDLVTDVHGISSFDEEYAKSGSIDIEGIQLKILPLEDIIASKKFLNREKDKSVIPALENALLAKKEAEKE